MTQNLSIFRISGIFIAHIVTRDSAHNSIQPAERQQKWNNSPVYYSDMVLTGHGAPIYTFQTVVTTQLFQATQNFRVIIMSNGGLMITEIYFIDVS